MNRMVGPASLLAAGLAFCFIFSSLASAASFTGTPSNGLVGSVPDPRFGTLINFDDNQPTGADILAVSGIPPLGSGDYASLGVASITETSGIGFLGLFSPSPQSPPNYVGTGFANDFGGTILIQFTNLADKVGIGFSDSLDTHTLNIYDAAGLNSTPLESLTILPGGPAANTYVGFERPSFDIAYFQITGNFFLIDDLQFESQQTVPEPATSGLLGCSLLGLLLLAGRKCKKARLII